MVTLPSPPETPSRTAPVASFETVTFAPLTTASFWSTTTTINEAVFGDCATDVCAKSSADRSSVKRGVVRRAKVLKSDMAILPGFDCRKVLGQKSSPKGRRMADDKAARELLPAAVFGVRSGFVRNFPRPRVSRVKKRCKAVSSVIQCTANRGA